MRQLKILLLLSIGIFFLGQTVLIESLEIEGKIYKNIYVKDIDLSNLTKEEAKSKINKILEKNNKLNLIFDNDSYEIKLDEIDVDYKVDNLVEKAYNVGRNKDIISNIKTKLKLNSGQKFIIDFDYIYNNQKLDKYISYIEKELNINPENANIKIVEGFIKVDKEVYGKKVDTIELRKAIINKIENVYIREKSIPIDTIKPRYTYEELAKVDTVLGSYETYFNPKSTGRVNNIRVAARATSNTILGINEEFSFNNVTKSANISPYLKKAPVIINGKLEEGLGGGICQVSSTIYNAALYAGLKITNIRNHSLPSSYISKGRDATVTTGVIDLKFENNFKTPIFIYNKVYDDKIVSTIYGNKYDKKNIEVITEVVETLPNKVKLKVSDDLNEGEKNIEEKGRIGYKVNTYRIYKGKYNSVKEFIYKSYYPPKDEVIMYGIKKENNELPY